MKIIPITHPLHASVRVPGSKSLTNRALLIAALADGTTRLTGALFSDDSLHFADALKRLGFEVHFDSERAEMTVTGFGGRIPAKKADLFIGNAGTAARFLSAFLTLGAGDYILDGDSRMRERPLGDLVEALEQLGAKVEPVNRKSSIVNRFVRPSKSLLPACRVAAPPLPGIFPASFYRPC
jgi:3-phosphoshikimate 1-carboxyvinyltransferase